MDKKPTLSLEEVKAIAQKAHDDWCAQNLSKENIEKRVTEYLDRHTCDIVAKMLGFDNKWGGGRWEVDHCNGRSGESAIGDFFRTMAGEAVSKWLLKQAKGLPKLSPGAIKEMRREYLAVYRKKLQEKLSKVAEENAQKDATEVIERVLNPKEEAREAVDAKLFDES